MTTDWTTSWVLLLFGVVMIAVAGVILYPLAAHLLDTLQQVSDTIQIRTPK